MEIQRGSVSVEANEPLPTEGGDQEASFTITTGPLLGVTAHRLGARRSQVKLFQGHEEQTAPSFTVAYASVEFSTDAGAEHTLWYES